VGFVRGQISEVGGVTNKLFFFVFRVFFRIFLKQKVESVEALSQGSAAVLFPVLFPFPFNISTQGRDMKK